MQPKRVPTQQLLSPPEPNHLYRGDCLSVLDRIEDNSVDLIYIDPPFYSQRYYETIEGEDAERFAFEDRWRGGIQTYLNYLAERCRKMHEKLKATGSMYVHLDWHICHYMKVELDRIFGYQNFRNEVIWFYGAGGRSKRCFGRKHDTILFYSKSDDYTFNGHDVRIEMKAGKTSFGGRLRKDKDGRIYREVWGTGSKKLYRYYLDEGKIPEDVWEIPSIQSQDRERLGYPTQKPIALLDRIVRASSDRGNLVLDAFCGCGTTMEAAQLLQRRWIGIDISQSALRVVQNRLKKIGAPPTELHNMIASVEQLRELSWQEFQSWAVDAVQGRHSPRKIADMGIDGFTFLEHHPIQVKQVESEGRPIIDNFVGVLRRERERRGMIIAFSFTKGAIAEVARLLREDALEIELLTCRQILEEDLPFRTIS